MISSWAKMHLLVKDHNGAGTGASTEGNESSTPQPTLSSIMHGVILPTSNTDPEALEPSKTKSPKHYFLSTSTSQSYNNYHLACECVVAVSVIFTFTVTYCYHAYIVGSAVYSNTTRSKKR